MRRSLICMLVFAAVALFTIPAAADSLESDQDSQSDQSCQVNPAGQPVQEEGTAPENPGVQGDGSNQAGNPSVEVSEETVVTVAAVGDIMLVGGVRNLIAQYGPFYPFEKVAPILSRADLAFGNLESPLARGGQPTPHKRKEAVAAGKDYVFKGSPEDIPGLVAAGFDVLALANNHMLDFGPEALLETTAALENAQIKSVGAGANLAEARRPAIAVAKGLRVAFLAFSYILPPNYWATDTQPGVAPARSIKSLAPDKAGIAALQEDLASARAQAEVVIVSFHWGEEKQNKANAFQQLLARAAIDAGADAVIGHHPHVLQGIEIYKGRPIFYSLGNFVYTPGNEPAKEAVIATLTFKGREVTEVELWPIYISMGQPQPATGSRAGAIIGNLSAYSASYGTRVVIKEDRAYLFPGADAPL